MNRFLILSIAASVIIFGTVPVFAASIDMDAGSGEASSGDAVTIPITVTGASGIGAMHVELTFDNSVLQVSSVEKGSLIPDNSLMEVNTDETGRIVVGIVTLDGIDGDGTLLTARFTSKGQAGQSSSLNLENVKAWEGDTDLAVLVNTENGKFTVKQVVTQQPQADSGGCLIATATFGSELASQVQQLRELRDGALLQTSSGSSFMTGFNQLYYSFSPTVADWERQSPVFKEAVKLTITPLLTSLSLLNYVDMESESQVLGYGISLILLNVGMYFVAPAFAIFVIKKRISSKY